MSWQEPSSGEVINDLAKVAELEGFLDGSVDLLDVDSGEAAASKIALG